MRRASRRIAYTSIYHNEYNERQEWLKSRIMVSEKRPYIRLFIYETWGTYT